MECFAGQQEKAPSTGRLHWQCAVTMKKRVGLKTVKLICPKGHWEASRSEAINEYVNKLETSITGTKFKYGNLPIKRNDKADWKRVRELAKIGKFEEIPDDIYVRYVRNLEHINRIHLEPKEREVEALLYWGPPGSGKTRRASSELAGCYWKLSTNKWWDGYRGQKSVLIDDFSGAISYDHLKRWLDRYPCLLEVKGGTVVAEFDRIIITSNTLPREWWPKAEECHIEAINRRLKIEYIGDPKNLLTIQKNSPFFHNINNSRLN